MRDKLNNWIDNICGVIYTLCRWLCMLFLAVMVGTVLLSVFGRYVFKSSPAWTEELAIICIIWLCMLSAQMGVYDGIHIRMTIIETIFPEKVWKGIYRYADIVPLAVNVLILFFGCKIAATNGGDRLPSSGWPALTEYLGLIVSGIAGIILAAGRIIRGEKK